MRGNLPGSSNISEAQSALSEEEALLFDKKHTCPICEANFTAKTPRAGKLASDGMDDDLRPRYRNLDALKYRIIECPVCGYADLEKFFETVRKREIPSLRNGALRWDREAELEGTVIDYPQAYARYKSAIRCNLIRGAQQSKRAYTALCTAWLLRGWRESIEDEGKSVSPSDTMGQLEEMKLIRYAAKNYKEAETKEGFPMSGMEESTYDYLMAALSYKTNERSDAERYVLRALRSRELKTTLRTRAEDLREELKKLKKMAP